MSQQPPTANDIAKAVTASAANELSAAMNKVQHCLHQLSDEQIWSRENESRNSIGNLILHMSGNLRQWIVSGIGGAKDVRDRPREFAERRLIARAGLLEQLEFTVRQAIDALQSIDAENLMRIRPVQDRQLTGLAAVFNTTCHFWGHTQEIIHMTRTLLGDAYQFKGRSATSH